ncbi:single-strand DNA-binding protein [Alkalithermobacter thermoalcaliphilus JW-YL-7 = DSM 7308]|uniref:Single-stranded DNA-binding protein n=1 Tax=Alkalithermobacter thermoalcaliphilus JW-YL-7 = DSM 7308 TaxID=1121328 RepID=A0A150FQZ0_CLOPD|nr:single-strand binding protein [[Clostridium] paradoxum JW-YL-7 = DSM 7308]SHL12790.1 single-strand DNA-binding protein [[Clostridium] paradoxum JW-YL-7 = DSM 7308]
MNNVALVGRLTKDPDLKYIPGGTAVATFSIAVNREFTSKEGKREVDFINIEVWNKQAENCANYLSKGSLVSVQGALRVDRYETSTGEKRTIAKVKATRVEFLGSKKTNELESFTEVDFEETPFA